MAQPNGISVDGIIAVVGKEIILRSDLQTAYQRETEQYGVVENPDELYCDILKNLIIEELFIHQADLDSIMVSDAEIEYRINANINYLVQQVGGDPSVIEKYYNKKMDEIKKDLREMMRKQLLTDKVHESITKNITITPSEVKAYFEKFPYDSLPTVQGIYEFGHIVKIPPVSDVEIEALKAKLNSFRDRILHGEKLSTFARLYSDDPGSASKNGDLGFVERGVFYPEFEAAAFRLKTGEVSPIVQTKAGYHIIQMIERRGDQIHVAHILLQPKPSVEEQAAAIEYLDSIRKVIIDNKMDFSKAALVFSDDPNKNSGGWVTNPYSGGLKFEKDAVDAVVLPILKSLAPGEYSKAIPFVNEDGKMAYRLIYLKTKTAPHKSNMMEDYDMIQQAALENKKYKAIDKWILNKVKLTSIKINKEFEHCSFNDEWNIH